MRDRLCVSSFILFIGFGRQIDLFSVGSVHACMQMYIIFGQLCMLAVYIGIESDDFVYIAFLITAIL